MEKIFAFNSKLFKITLLSIIFAEFFSLYGFAYSFLNKVFFILIVLGVLYLSWKKLIYGVYIVLAELIIASKGYLFYFELGEKAISIRIGIFIALMAVWLIKVLIDSVKSNHRLGREKIEFLKSKLLPYYLALFAFVLWGVIQGVAKNNLGNVFFDFNGWLYFALLLPFFDAIKKDNIQDLLNVILAAITGLILKTFIILLIFSHQVVFLIPEIYKWIRVTGVGEIADMGSGFYRIFFQSHIFAVFGFFALLPVVNKKFVHQKEKIKDNYKLVLLVVALFSLIIISLSRSFWVGSIFTFLIFYITSLFVFREKIKQIIVSGVMVLVILLSSIFLITAVVKAPLPFGSSDVDLSSILSDRTTNLNEAAVGSRWNLFKPLWVGVKDNLIIGSGFGKTVTYETLDPRALENNTDGLYTTFTFEWGYLDLWLKLGIFGLIAYLILIWQILKSGWALKEDKLLFGFLLGEVALVAIHFFTPYLNHPLGIGYLVFLSVVFTASQKSKTVVN